MNEIDLVAEERLVIINAIEREMQSYTYWGDHTAAAVLLRIVEAMREGRI